ncbi:MAG TPA: cellulase family glycosylhydrolase [Chthonomonadaceae bacterium]|nr:cellulase family glycosylhydrolase [Chthonomonadaceae bacterium]
MSARLVPLLMALALLAPAPGSAQNRRRHPLPVPSVPDSLGVNIHFTDPKPGEIEQLAAAGFRWIRMDFAWAGIEREKGRYDFSAYDRLVAALRPHKIRPLFILDYGNDLYQQGSPRTPEARAAFARFAAAAVTHFKNQGILWEMWNEPNIGFWQPKPNVEEYIALALEVGRTIRAVAPEEWYIGPGVSGMDFAFMEKCFQAGLLQYWDAVSFHPYRNTPPETAASDFRRLREIIARYAPQGKSVPILSSEWGYSELYPGLNLERQSKYIAREFLSNLASGLIVSIWYDWHDDGTDPKETEHHFGTVYNDYRPKPTYKAAQTLTRTLDGFRFQRRLELSSPDDYCLIFSKGRALRLAVWTTAPNPHEVVLPTGAGKFRIYNYLGEPSDATADASGLRLTLTDAPQYLLPSGRNSLLYRELSAP